MPFADAQKNAAIDALLATVTHVALLDESLTELAGGTYARNAIAWDAAAAGVGDNTATETFNVPGGNTVAFIGFETDLAAGDGKMAGWWPVGGYATQVGIIEADDDFIESKGHGLTDGMRVVVMDINAAGLPTGLTEGVVYWVRDAATDVFKVSLTSGGAAVNITADGEVFFTRCLPETFAGDGTYAVAAGDLDVSGLLI